MLYYSILYYIILYYYIYIYIYIYYTYIYCMPRLMTARKPRRLTAPRATARPHDYIHTVYLYICIYIYIYIHTYTHHVVSAH